MAGLQGTSTRHDFHEGLAALSEAERADMFTTGRGRIISYDSATQTAKIKPLLRRNFGDQTLDAPDLEDVHVRHPRAGGNIIHQPLKAGDYVTLHSDVRSTEDYDADGGTPLDASSGGRMHSLTDAFAVPGCFPTSMPAPGLPGDRMHVGSLDAKRGFQRADDGSVDIVGGPDGEKKYKVAPNGKIDIKANGQSLVKAVKEMAESLQACEKAFNAIGNVPAIALALQAAGVSLPTITMPAVVGRITNDIWMGE